MSHLQRLSNSSVSSAYRPPLIDSQALTPSSRRRSGPYVPSTQPRPSMPTGFPASYGQTLPIGPTPSEPHGHMPSPGAAPLPPKPYGDDVSPAVRGPSKASATAPASSPQPSASSAPPPPPPREPRPFFSRPIGVLVKNIVYAALVAAMIITGVALGWLGVLGPMLFCLGVVGVPVVALFAGLDYFNWRQGMFNQ